jgi:hypothetical protein
MNNKLFNLLGKYISVDKFNIINNKYAEPAIQAGINLISNVSINIEVLSIVVS